MNPCQAEQVFTVYNTFVMLCLGSIGIDYGHFPVIALLNFMVKRIESHNMTVLYPKVK